MTYFDKNAKLNVDVIVEEVKLKERILKLLKLTDYVKDLERNCFCFHQKLQSENSAPFYANLSLKFGILQEGKRQKKFIL
jgi:hypothetical protein